MTLGRLFAHAQDDVAKRLDETTRGPAGPTEDPMEEGASSDATLQRTGRCVRHLRHHCDVEYDAGQRYVRELLALSLLVQLERSVGSVV